MLKIFFPNDLSWCNTRDRIHGKSRDRAGRSGRKRCCCCETHLAAVLPSPGAKHVGKFGFCAEGGSSRGPPLARGACPASSNNPGAGGKQPAVYLQPRSRSSPAEKHPARNQVMPHSPPAAEAGSGPGCLQPGSIAGGPSSLAPRLAAAAVGSLAPRRWAWRPGPGRGSCREMVSSLGAGRPPTGRKAPGSPGPFGTRGLCLGAPGTAAGAAPLQSRMPGE